MGTSRSDPGPTGDRPLLPPWAPDLPPFPEPDEDPEYAPDGDPGDPGDQDGDDVPGEPDVSGDGPDQAIDAIPLDPLDPLDLDGPSWNGARRTIGSLAGSAHTGERARDYVQRAVSGVVRGLGGSLGATRSAIGGRAAARNVAAFLAAVATTGVAGAARAFRVEAYLGGDVTLFLAGLVDALAPAGGTTEDAVARAAVALTLEELLTEYAIGEDGLAGLEQLAPAAIDHVIETLIANYAAERALQTLSSRIEARSVTPERAIVIEAQIRDFVRASVELEFRGRDPRRVDWMGRQGDQIMAQLFHDAFAVLQAAQ
jgi:hypothetical protein